MSDNFTVYVKTDCNFCKKAINLLQKKNEKFIVIVTDKNTDFLQKIKETHNMTTVPIIVKESEDNSELIGGFQQLKYFFDEKEDVTKQKLTNES